MWAFTRYSFTSKLSCTGQPSWYHLHCSNDYNTIARLLRNIRPLGLIRSDAIHHTISVTAISCEGQTTMPWCPPPVSHTYPPLCMAQVGSYPNLFVTRTFSKTWGMPSLRIGYLIAHDDNIKVYR